MSVRYAQFCPVAKASEVFAARWTPLILRELMSGMHAFNDIHRGVPLISRAVLVARLRELDNNLSVGFDTGPETAIALRARGRVLVISEALSTHGTYFDTRATA